MDVDEEVPQNNAPNTAPVAHMEDGDDVLEKEDIVDERYDVELQESLLEEGVKTAGKERQAFERFLSIFPTAGAVWNRWVVYELSNKQYEAADAIFKRSLEASMSIELWMTYIKYVRESINASKKGPLERRNEIKTCFEYALGHIGMDMNATQLWEEYITWLKEAGVEPSTIADVYVRALSNPMHKLDQIWHEYEKFVAKSVRVAAMSTNEVSAKYSTAKRVFEDKLKQTEGLAKNPIAVPPRENATEGAFSSNPNHASHSAQGASNSSSGQSGTSGTTSSMLSNVVDMHQAKLWKQVIQFERSNPQDLDQAKLGARVTFTYNQALIALYHYPEIWHQAAQYQLEIGRVDDAKRLYAFALNVLPTCLLLHFQFCDFLELNNFMKEADIRYKQIVSVFGNEKELVWIQYMYYARRVHGIQAARKVFFKVRKLAIATYHCYVAAAQLEFYVNKDAHVARKVYELGYHQFEHEPLFLNHYVNFLYHQSEDSHMRVLFEKILANLPPSQSLELWNRFIQFETICGNLEPAIKLQTRRSQRFPAMDPSGILAAVQRYRFLELWPCSNAELASFQNDFEIDDDYIIDDSDDAAKKPSNNDLLRRPNKNLPSSASPSSDLTADGSSLTMPDLKQLQLYKGIGIAGQSATSATLSFRLDELMGRLPSARDWSGPMVNIELLMQSILNFIEIPTVIATSRHAAAKAEDDDDSGLQARARESAMANDHFRQRVARSNRI